MNIQTGIFNEDDLPDHLHQEVQKYADLLFRTVAPLMNDATSLNFLMAAMNWVSFLCIKEFVADHHQEKAVLNCASAIIKNLELFKDREFLKEAKAKWDERDRYRGTCPGCD